MPIDTKKAEELSAIRENLGPPQRLNHLEALFRSAPIGLCFIDLDFKFREANDHLAKLFNVPLDQLIGAALNIILGSAGDVAISLLRTAQQTKKPVQIDLALMRSLPSGNGLEQLECAFSAEPLFGESNNLLGFSIAFLEIRPPVVVEEPIREQEEHLRVAIGLNNQILWTANAQGEIIEMGDAWSQITGHKVQDALVHGWKRFIHPEDELTARERWQCAVVGITRYEDSYRISAVDSEWRWISARAVPKLESDGTVTIWFGTIEDIHERKKMEIALSTKMEWLEDASQQIASLAHEDHLTGLANRRHLDSVLKDELKRAERSEQGVALIMLDVDHFKLFNDRWGHVAGDDCLRAVATALRSVAHRPGDLAARYGGEEFVILLPGTDEEGALIVAEHAVDAVRALQIEHPSSPYGIVTVSAGVGVLNAAGSGGANEKLLLELADAALYAAKNAGRNRVAGFGELRESEPESDFNSDVQSNPMQRKRNS